MIPIVPIRDENLLALPNLSTPAEDHAGNSFPEPIEAETKDNAPMENQPEEPDHSSLSSDSEISSESLGSNESNSEGGGTEKEH